MFGIGVQELVVVFVIALLIFGPKRLPELARSLGKGLAEFRRASNDLRQSFSLDADPPPPQAGRSHSIGDPRRQREAEGRPAQAVDPELAEKLWGTPGSDEKAAPDTESEGESSGAPETPAAEKSGD